MFDDWRRSVWGRPNVELPEVLTMAEQLGLMPPQYILRRVAKPLKWRRPQRRLPDKSLLLLCFLQVAFFLAVPFR